MPTPPAITIYHNPACGTSRNTLAMIRNSGVEPLVIEYLVTPPSRETLEKLLGSMSMPVRELLRRKGTPYDDLGLDGPQWSDESLLDLVVQYPILMNRPVVVTPLGTRLCRPSEAVLDILPTPQQGAFTKEDGEVVIDSQGRRVNSAAGQRQPPIALRQAGPADWPAVEALLLANKLPTEGAREHLATYFLATSDGKVVGSVGAEVYGTVALLRSAAVAPGWHRQGIGRLLVERLLQEARSRGIASLHLLTVTAPEYFASYGFKRGKIEEAPVALKASAEFQGACPACAAFMTLKLHEAPVQYEGQPAAVIGAVPASAAAPHPTPEPLGKSRCCG